MIENPYLEGTPEEFFEKNEGLVHYCAKRYINVLNTNPTLEYGDLISMGMEGMIKAYTRFDPSKFENKPKFSTYAVPMIQGEIRRYLRDDMDTIKFSRRAKSMYMELLSKDLIGHSIEDILEETGASYKAINAALDYGKFRYLDSMDEVVREDNNSFTRADMIPETVDFDTELILNEFKSTLTENEKEIVNLLCSGYSQKEVGDRLTLSQTQVSRIFKKALAKAEDYQAPRNDVRNFVESCKDIHEGEVQRTLLDEWEVEGLKNAFWGSEKTIVEQVELLSQDMQLSILEIAEITEAPMELIVESRQEYLKSMSLEEVQRAMSELTKTTDLSMEDIDKRLGRKVDKGGAIMEQDKAKKQSVDTELVKEVALDIFLTNSEIAEKSNTSPGTAGLIRKELMTEMHQYAIDTGILLLTELTNLSHYHIAGRMNVTKQYISEMLKDLNHVDMLKHGLITWGTVFKSELIDNYVKKLEGLSEVEEIEEPVEEIEEPVEEIEEEVGEIEPVEEIEVPHMEWVKTWEENIGEVIPVLNKKPSPLQMQCTNMSIENIRETLSYLEKMGHTILNVDLESVSNE